MTSPWRAGRLRAALATLVLTLAIPVGVAPAAARTIEGLARIHDGDTLHIGAETLRLEGVDAPELAQHCARAGGGAWPCGRVARDRLMAMTEGRRISCDVLGEDRYDRLLARCRLNGADVAEALIAQGLAWAFRRYSMAYADVEDRARAAGLGVWQAPTQPPWDFRAARWTTAAQAAPRPDCPIKGNIARDGERIYHTPWSPWYDRTRISPHRGERWFCDEAEAVAAGWRAARF